MNADCYWQTPAPYGAQRFSAAWNQPSKPMQRDNRICSSETDSTRGTSSGQNSVAGDSTPPRALAGSRVPGQSAARAAKRQRGRERRKMFKAAARADADILEDASDDGSADADRQRAALGFEGRVDDLATQVKLVVKNTFFDVAISEDSDSDDSESSLPMAFFKTNSEIDCWRRDYRRFRLGHHQGAKGEVTEKDFERDALSALDLRA